VACVVAQTADEEPQRKQDYQTIVARRAEKIVATLSLADTNKAARVREIIARQYRDLNQIHTERDTLAREASVGKVKAAAAIQPELDKLHGEFLARLGAELSPGQVDQVKDGLTYGVAPLTYGVYLRMYPELTNEQKAQIKAWLNEAREIAMDGSTSQEKHAVFGKYKGKINNLLAKAGYDTKKGEANLKESGLPAPELKTKRP